MDHQSSMILMGQKSWCIGFWWWNIWFFWWWEQWLTPTPTYASVGPSDHHHLAIHPGAALHLGHWSGNNHWQSEPAPLEPSFGVPSAPMLPQVSPMHHGSNSSPIKKKRVLFSGGSWISFYIYQLRLCSVYTEVRSEHKYIYPPILHQFWSGSIGL